MKTPLDSSSAQSLEVPEITQALARNDRYVKEFVEAFNLCPYARRCRETGKLHRTVLIGPGGLPGTPEYDALLTRAADTIARIETEPPETIEVALIVFPALVPELSQGEQSARAFEQFVTRVRERMQARHGGGDTPFYCVPFHPDFPEDLTDEHRAVRFIRRSPDPTIQLVRGSVLRAVRGVDPGNSRFVDVSKMTAAELMAITVPLSVSDRIAKANHAELLAQGPERLRALLAGMRKA